MGKTTSVRLSSSITILAASFCGGFALASICCVTSDSCSSFCSDWGIVAAVVVEDELSNVASVGSVSSLVADSEEDSDDEVLTHVSVVASWVAVMPSPETMFVGSITVTVVAATHWAIGVNGIVLSVSSPTLVSISGSSEDEDGTSTGVIAGVFVLLVHIVTSGVMELDGDFASLIIWPSIVGPDSCVLVNCTWSLESPLPVADPIDCTTEVLVAGCCWKLCCCEDRTEVALPFTSDFLLSDLFTPRNGERFCERVFNEKDANDPYLYYQYLSWMSSALHRNRLPH